MAANGKPKAEFRALPHGYELRADDEGMPTLIGSLAVFDEWTEINSKAEGHFLERIAPGAFYKRFCESSETASLPSLTTTLVGFRSGRSRKSGWPSSGRSPSRPMPVRFRGFA